MAVFHHGICRRKADERLVPRSPTYAHKIVFFKGRIIIESLRCNRHFLVDSVTQMRLEWSVVRSIFIEKKMSD